MSDIICDILAYLAFLIATISTPFADAAVIPVPATNPDSSVSRTAQLDLLYCTLIQPPCSSLSG